VPTRDRSSDRARADRTEIPERAAESVARARKHARAAIAEALAAAGALLDATSLALNGDTAANSAVLSPIARLLQGLRAELEGNATPREIAALLRSIADALDAEIARWQARAETDAEARAVLRAFLGLRELLWEFGIRRESEASEREEATPRSARKTGRSTRTRRKQQRVQRVTVEG